MKIPQKLLQVISASPGEPLSYAKLAKAIEHNSPAYIALAVRILIRKKKLRIVSHVFHVGTVYEIIENSSAQEGPA